MKRKWTYVEYNSYHIYDTTEWNIHRKGRNRIIDRSHYLSMKKNWESWNWIGTSGWKSNQIVWNLDEVEFGKINDQKVGAIATGDLRWTARGLSDRDRK